MRLPLQHLEKTGSSGLAVRAYFPDGRQQSLEVCEYKGLIIRSGDGCGLRLEFPEVAPLHCLLSLDHNELVVQDWYTKTGTLLNGVRINETKVAPGDEIRIGPCRIVIEW